MPGTAVTVVSGRRGVTLSSWRTCVSAGAVTVGPAGETNEKKEKNARWARDWRALALTQVHHWSRLSDSGEDGEALSSVHSTALAVGKLIHNLLCEGRVKND